MNINWNDAPEGATHWEPESSAFEASWMRKNTDGTWSFFSSSRGVWISGVASCEVPPKREATFIPRHWDGIGFPPIGIEAVSSKGGIKILAVDEGRGKVAVQLLSNNELDVMSVTCITPAKTEADKAVDDMLAHIEARYEIELEIPAPSLAIEYTIRQMISAGYRKQEVLK